MDSGLTMNSYSEDCEKCWPKDQSARRHFYSILTSVYALVVIVFAMVIDLSQQFSPGDWIVETIFYSYMYGVGLLFLAYCYLFMIHPGWYNHILTFLGSRKWISNYKQKMITPAGHESEGAGSLYLRLGTLFFGSLGIGLFGLEMLMCLSDSKCYDYQFVNLLLAAVFTFLQMHFLFCNSKIQIVSSKHLAKLGTMHLVAVNLWTWMRFILAKLSSKAAKAPVDEIDANLTVGATTAAAAAAIKQSGLINSFYFFGDFATFLTTCIVEYSVIGAAIMFVMWKSIDEKTDKHEIRKKKKSNVRVDCSSSSGGLFAGVFFLIFAFVSIGMCSYFYKIGDNKSASLAIRIGDIILFSFALLGCIVGLYRMRLLQYTHLHSTKSEFLDELLLFIGLIGEMVFCSTGLVCWIATQKTAGPDKMDVFVLFVLIVRCIQVILQSLFISLASRLRCLSQSASESKPGKQFVTFLLIANVSLFFFHTFEGIKSVFGDGGCSELTKPYSRLALIVAPLTVFYRFHSSVCLADIWKHSYSIKNILSRNSPMSDESRSCTGSTMSSISDMRALR